MKLKPSFNILALIALLFTFLNVSAGAVNPVATDSRIRTFVYGENEVFNVLTSYGYQSSIELAEGEKIVTLSIGNPVAFKITPSGNRLFIKTMQNDSVTNMTVITNMRTYYFELSSKIEEGQDLVYVMRFYYPEDDFDKVKFDNGAIKSVAIDDIGSSTPLASKPSLDDNMNYNYSMTGPESVSPLKIFDDGHATYFKFPGDVSPTIFGVAPDGKELPVPAKRSGEYIVVDGVTARISLRLGKEVVCVFNENLIR